LVLGWLCQLFPNVRDALTIVRPETVVRWHRAGFRSYWRWKSSRRAGRPALPADVRYLIREISIANPLWGASRIHGGLLKLGHRRGQTSVAKYLTPPAAAHWMSMLVPRLALCRTADTGPGSSRGGRVRLPNAA
jgi:hypothetical protein